MISKHLEYHSLKKSYSWDLLCSMQYPVITDPNRVGSVITWNCIQYSNCKCKTLLILCTHKRHTKTVVPFYNMIIFSKIFTSVNNIFDLQCTHSCNFYLFHLCSKENTEWLTGYTRPFHGWLVTHGQPGRCSPGWLRCHAHSVVRGWPAAQKAILCGWRASGGWQW